MFSRVNVAGGKSGRKKSMISILDQNRYKSIDIDINLSIVASPFEFVMIDFDRFR